MSINSSLPAVKKSYEQDGTTLQQREKGMALAKLWEVARVQDSVVAAIYKGKEIVDKTT